MDSNRDPLKVRTLDIEAIRRELASTLWVWTFDPDRPTYLECIGRRGEPQQWGLTYTGDPRARYSIEVRPTAQGLIDVVTHVSAKSWVDPGTLLKGLLPAFRALAWKR